jgi:hypothetical protein
MDEIGLFRRLGVSSRSALTGIAAGIAGTGALGTSLVVDWQHLSLSLQSGSNDPGFSDIRQEFTLGLGQMPYSDVYVIGVLGLLAMLGAAVARADRAHWLRFAATALGLGLVALVAVMVYFAEPTFAALYFGDDTLHTSERLLGGGYWALGAVAAIVAGVWLTAGPASAVPVATPVAEAVPTSAPPSPPAAMPPPTGRVGFLDGLTVTTSEPIDVGSGSDVLRT